MRTSQAIFKNILNEHMPPNSWLSITEIYALIEQNIGSFQSDDFDPQADYNQQESWKRNLRNVLQQEKRIGRLEWDGKANYMLKIKGKGKPKSTGQKSNADLLEGDKLYIQRARQVLPILVRQARAEQTITYSDLAEEVEMPNPRNLNYPLGVIGNALEALAKRTKRKKLPVINCLVVNQRDGLPGEGITWFIDKKDFDKQTKNQKEKTIDRLLADIYAYPDWYWVLNQLGLKPSTTDYQEKIKSKKTKGFGGRGGGESPQHLRFKNYIAKNPELFGLRHDLKGQTEYELPSMDTIDVLFICGDERIGVEVKSRISDAPDISRGLFQCVKYKALIEAEQKANDNLPNCRVALALEGQLPKELIGLKNQLGIEVFEKKKKKK